MHHQVFNDAAARTLLRVLSHEQMAIRSVRLCTDPEITVLIQDSELYKRYLAQLAPDDESLAEVHLQEQLIGWYGDDEGAVTLELVEAADGNISWKRTSHERRTPAPWTLRS